jgi:phasin family protein
MNGEAMQMWEQMNDVGKTTMESLLKFNEITSRSVERMAQQQLAMMGGCFESTVSHLKALSEGKGVQDVLLGQTRLATECSEKWMASTRTVIEISLQAQADLGQWMNESLNRLNVQTLKTAEQVQETVRQVA